jgi:pentapeptide MXKDX repeat protein
LAHAPDISAAVEIVIRRCYFHHFNHVQPSSSARALQPLGRETPNDVTEASQQISPASVNASRDAMSRDATSRDAASRDAGSRDAGSRDATSRDATSRDATSRDAESRDAESRDATSRDAGSAASGKPISTGALPGTSLSGFCLTAYVTGFGDEENEPRRRWEIALALMQHALVQVSRT